MDIYPHTSQLRLRPKDLLVGIIVLLALSAVAVASAEESIPLEELELPYDPDYVEPELAPGEPHDEPGGWRSVPIYHTGRVDNRVDFVIVGSGYALNDQPGYAEMAEAILQRFLAEEPFASYREYLNFHRVDVVAEESGVDTFVVDVNRAIILRAVAANAPDTDQIIALANKPFRSTGGSGISRIAAIVGRLASPPLVARTTMHEVGHAFGKLADEYWYSYASPWPYGEHSAANVSIYDPATMRSLETKWHLWLDPACQSACEPPCSNNQAVCTLCSDPNCLALCDKVCTFEGGSYAPTGIYRPTFRSLMNDHLHYPFSPVNSEQLVMKIYELVSPIDGATLESAHPLPAGSAFFVQPMRPVGHELDVQWAVDTVAVPGATQNRFVPDYTALVPGLHDVSVTVVDNTPFVKDQSKIHGTEDLARATLMTATRRWQVEVLTDCNSNGLPDGDDVLSGTSTDVNTNSIPDECEPDCDGDGVPDPHVIDTQMVPDCDGNYVPDACDPDCDGNGVPDTCDLSAGSAQDCNVNQVPDPCDVSAGFSNDVNLNGVPDECEPNCNHNGAPDDYDISSGSSSDCNGNAIPDECEAPPESDGDGIPTVCDNCPDHANADQANSDADGLGDACDLCPNTVPGAVVDAQGCPALIPFDFDWDGDVDGSDFERFAACATGPAVSGPPAGCTPEEFVTVDHDADGDVDQLDFAAFQRCCSGEDHPADPGCAE